MPDGLDQILSDPQFKTLSPEAQRIVIGQNDAGFAALSPTAQAIVHQKLMSGTVKSMVQKPAPPPGAVQRFTEAVGLPTSLSELPDSPSLYDIPIFGPAARIAKGYYQANKQALGEGSKEFSDAVQNVKEGGPVLPNVDKAAWAVGKGALEGPLSIVGGQVVSHFGEDIANKNYSGAGGGALGAVALAALSRLGGKEPKLETRANKLSYAMGASGSSANYPAALKTAMPELDKAAASLGHAPTTVADLQQVVGEAFRLTENEFNTALHPIASRPTIPTLIADAIRREAGKLNPKNTVEATLRNRLLNRAVEFEQPWTYGELNQQRMNANARLRAFESGDASAKQANLRTKADVMVDKAIADGSREIVYDALSQFHSTPGVPADFSALKSRQSALTIINDQLNGHVNELANATASKDGTPFLSGRSTSFYGHPGGRVGMSFHHLQDFFISPTSGANKAVTGAFSKSAPKGAVVAATAPARTVADTQPYKTPEEVMLAMKNGEIDQATGTKILQQLNGRGSAGITRPMRPPQ